MRILLEILFVFLLASRLFAAEDQILMPGEIGVTCQNPQSTGNQMVCARVVARQSITGVTDFAFFMATTFSATCGGAIYSDSDATSGTLLGSAHASCTAGKISATGLTPFNITKDSYYRICYCATVSNGGSTTNCNGSGVGFVVGEDTATGTAHFADLSNNFVSTTIGTAGQSCSTGTPPAGTGTLTGINTVKHVLLINLHHN